MVSEMTPCQWGWYSGKLGRHQIKKEVLDLLCYYKKGVNEEIKKHWDAQVTFFFIIKNTHPCPWKAVLLQNCSDLLSSNHIYTLI